LRRGSLLSALVAIRAQRGRQVGVAGGREHRHREQRRVGGAGLADRERRGTPAGICTIDSSESCPLRWRDATGTPSTGTIVFADSMPGRCAAPPAPAMIARSPRPSAASA
jgi:hypothetical protein